MVCCILSLFSHILQYCFNHFFSLLFFGQGLSLALSIKSLHNISLSLFESLLGRILGVCCLCLSRSRWCSRSSWCSWCSCCRCLLGLLWGSRLISCIGDSRLSGLCFLDLRVLLFIDRLFLLLLLGRCLWLLFSLSDLGGGSLCSSIISSLLLLLRFCTVHQFSFLQFIMLLRFYLGELIIGGLFILFLMLCLMFISLTQ